MAGGVCAVLDYDVEDMTDYVADMAIRVVTPECGVSDRFRKFVAQILSSTRLPSTTILLGLNYLAKRINTIRAHPQIHGPYKANEGEVWRYLTISLLLASKFLDDNTFQNRSWSEVTSIPVEELNVLEMEWLATCRWNLYVNLDKTKDYQAWLSDWKNWLETRKAEEEARIAKEKQQRRLQQQQQQQCKHITLPALQTSFTHHPTGLTSPLSAFSSGRSSFEQIRYGKNEVDWSYQVPITPPDSGYCTPEHTVMGNPVNYSYAEYFAQHPLPYNGYQNHGGHAQNWYDRSHAHFDYTHSPWAPGALVDCACVNCQISGSKSAFSRHGYDYHHQTMVN